MHNLDLLNLSIKRKKILENKGIKTVEDLMYRFPRKYHDYTIFKNANNAGNNERCAMRLLVMSVEYINSQNPFIKATCLDRGTQAKVIVLWFNMTFMYQKLRELRGKDVVCAGTFTINPKYFSYSFKNPDIFSDDLQSGCVLPVYSKIPGISDNFYFEIVKKSMSVADISEPLPDYILQKYELIDEKTMIYYMHFPESMMQVEEAYKKLTFDYIYEYAKGLNRDTQSVKRTSPFTPNLLTKTNELIKNLPYELTQDQKNVILSFIKTSQSGRRVNALIQGDVGCGKTVCAFLLMFAMADNGYQSALMAPTSVLARQHFYELKGYAEIVGYKAVYLGGDMKSAEKKVILKQIENGEADFVVGTHALVSGSVSFNNLALTVIDEEHKFGVTQREALKEKANAGVHSISMSATPIPRSLALAVFGSSMDVYNITTMPKGRKPVLTEVVNNDDGAFRFMLTQLKSGRQCYIVCPLITSEEKADLKEDGRPLPLTVEEAERKAHIFFDKYNISIGVVTGKMKESEKSKILDDFKT